MSELKVTVNILSAGGWEQQRFSMKCRLDAAVLIYHLTNCFGGGTLKDSEGAEIVSDPDNHLQPGVYFFTIGQDDSSAPNCWQATQPNESHLLFNQWSIGKLLFVTSAKIEGKLHGCAAFLANIVANQG
ncbi:g8577 [Coccomyxa viridis]|uniref:G8577 protein n=1 Tax=Coccomyxa viridis TaxID=1274662 RepID=A0ABP1G0R2_9CHLO